jgi:hypothetical protein
MLNRRLRVLALVLAILGALGAAAASTQTKRASCVSTPVPGQPGLSIVTCTKPRR